MISFQQLSDHYMAAVRQVEAEMGVELDRFRRGGLTCEDLTRAREGPWTDRSVQAPHFWRVPDLRAKPFWELADLPARRRALFEKMEASWEEVQEEFHRGASRSDFYSTGHTHVGHVKAWTQYPLRSKDKVWLPASERFPKIVSILRDIDEAGILIGPVYFASLSGHLRAHCGSSNIDLVMHFPLVVPEGDCWMRCGDEARKWEEGRWLTISDGFPHEAWNRTGSDRFILLITVPHPDLSEVELAGLMKIKRLIAPHYRNYFSTRKINKN